MNNSTTDLLAHITSTLTDAMNAVDGLKERLAVNEVVAEVELPTESGWYLGRAESPNYAILQLCLDADCMDSRDGAHWYRPEQGRVLSHVEVADYYLPLVKLEPVVETARKVFEQINEQFGENYTSNDEPGWDVVARHFGVQS